MASKKARKADGSPEALWAEQIAITWWGCMSTEVNIGSLTLVFDPYFLPDTPRVDYIFCSHPHYDHCHEATLRKLVGPTGGRLKMLFAPRGCFYASVLDAPTNFDDKPLSDLSFVPRDKAIAMVPNLRHEEDPEFCGVSELIHGRLKIEALRSDEDPYPTAEALEQDSSLAGTWPNLGYLVTDTQTGFALAHLGDIHQAYPQMVSLRGRVDVLIYPLGKFESGLVTPMMDLVRPKVAIPTHYRLFEEDFPIPAEFDRTFTDQQLYDNPDLLKKACQGHWYPSPADPVAEIQNHREILHAFTQVVELKAGRRYVLPPNLTQFAGRQRH